MDNTEQFVKIPCKVFKPQPKLKYWCNKCDQNAVDSDDAKSRVVIFSFSTVILSWVSLLTMSMLFLLSVMSVLKHKSNLS